MKTVYIILLAFILFINAGSIPVLEQPGTESILPQAVKEIQVDTITGSVSYNHPIQVPIGSAGLVPDISIVYNPGIENGIMGKGWNLNGVDSIYLDLSIGMDDSNKKYIAPNGDNLILQSAGIYKTETQSNAKYNYNDTSWEVILPSGQKLIYGSSDNSRIKDAGGNIIQWGLDKIEDLKGNSISFVYKDSNGDGVLYVESISYNKDITDTTKYKTQVSFGYKLRKDIYPAYAHGKLQKISYLLNTIKTKTNEIKGESYIFEYDETINIQNNKLFSRLTTIKRENYSDITIQYKSPIGVSYKESNDVYFSDLQELNYAYPRENRDACNIGQTACGCTFAPACNLNPGAYAISQLLCAWYIKDFKSDCEIGRKNDISFFYDVNGDNIPDHVRLGGINGSNHIIADLIGSNAVIKNVTSASGSISTTERSFMLPASMDKGIYGGFYIFEDNDKPIKIGRYWKGDTISIATSNITAKDLVKESEFAKFTSYMVSDLNNNGISELLYINKTNGVIVGYEPVGDKLVELFTIQKLGVDNKPQPLNTGTEFQTMVDLDNNGVPDFVRIGQNEKGIVLLVTYLKHVLVNKKITGIQIIKEEDYHWGNMGSDRNRSLADINGDGYLDYIVLHENIADHSKSIIYYLNTGKGFGEKNENASSNFHFSLEPKTITNQSISYNTNKYRDLDKDGIIDKVESKTVDYKQFVELELRKQNTEDPRKGNETNVKELLTFELKLEFQAQKIETSNTSGQMNTDTGASGILTSEKVFPSHPTFKKIKVFLEAGSPGFTLYPNCCGAGYDDYKNAIQGRTNLFVHIEYVDGSNEYFYAPVSNFLYDESSTELLSINADNIYNNRKHSKFFIDMNGDGAADFVRYFNEKIYITYSNIEKGNNSLFIDSKEEDFPSEALDTVADIDKNGTLDFIGVKSAKRELLVNNLVNISGHEDSGTLHVRKTPLPEGLFFSELLVGLNTEGVSNNIEYNLYESPTGIVEPSLDSTQEHSIFPLIGKFPVAKTLETTAGDTGTKTTYTYSGYFNIYRNYIYPDESKSLGFPGSQKEITMKKVSSGEEISLREDLNNIYPSMITEGYDLTLNLDSESNVVHAGLPSSRRIYKKIGSTYTLFKVFNYTYKESSFSNKSQIPLNTSEFSYNVPGYDEIVAKTSSVTYNSNALPETKTESSNGITVKEEFLYETPSDLDGIVQLPKTTTKYLNGKRISKQTLTYVGSNISEISEQGIEMSQAEEDLSTKREFGDYASGSPTTLTDPEGNITSLTYDSIISDLTTAISRKAGSNTFATKKTYDYISGAVKTITTPDGSCMENVYDKFHRLLLVKRCSGRDDQWLESIIYKNTGSKSYYPASDAQYVEKRKKIDDSTYTWVREYIDSMGRIYRTESKGKDDSTPVIQETVYDIEGKVRKRSNSYMIINGINTALWTKFLYDSSGALNKIIHPDGKFTNIQYSVEDGFYKKSSGLYSKDGLLIQGMVESYNSIGQLIEKKVNKAGKSFTTSYKYHETGKVSKIIDPTNGEVTIDYDSLGRKTSVVSSSSGKISYTYDTLNRITSTKNTKNAKDEIVSYQYDGLSRIVKKTSGGMEYNYTYDDASVNYSKGRFVKVTTPDGSSTEILEYDNNGNPLKIKKTINDFSNSFIVSMAYDLLGRVTSTTYPNGIITHNSYSSSGTLAQITMDTPSQDSFGHPVVTYDGPNIQDGNLTFTRTTGNGVKTEFKFDIVQERLKEIGTTLRPESSVTYDQRFVYSYNNSDSIEKISYISPISHALSEKFYNYDYMDRLTSVTDQVGNILEHFEYDNNGLGSTKTTGNLTKKNQYSLYYEQPNNPHRLTKMVAENGDLISYAYDETGNVTSRGLEIYTYDSFGQLINIGKGDESYKYSYDESGNRTHKKIKINEDLVSDTFYPFPGIYEVLHRPGHADLHTLYIKGLNGDLVTQLSLDNVTLATLENYKNSQPFCSANIPDCSSYMVAKASFYMKSFGRSLFFMDNFGNIGNYFRVISWMLSLLAAIVVGVYLSKENFRFLYNITSSLSILFVFLAFTNCGKASSGDSGSGDAPWVIYPLINSSDTPSIKDSSPSATDNPESKPTTESSGNTTTPSTTTPTTTIPPSTTTTTPPTNIVVPSSVGVLSGHGTPSAGMVFFHPDHLGSTTMMTDKDGNLVTGGGGASHIQYKAYGEVDRNKSQGPDIFRYKYTGQEEDRETGLYYYKSRYYDPQAGRFMQADSLIESNSAHGLNQYMYVNGNPIKYNDPTGHFPSQSEMFHMFNQTMKHMIAGITGGIKWASGGLQNAAKTYNQFVFGKHHNRNTLWHKIPRSDYGKFLNLEWKVVSGIYKSLENFQKAWWKNPSEAFTRSDYGQFYEKNKAAILTALAIVAVVVIAIFTYPLWGPYAAMMGDFISSCAYSWIELSIQSAWWTPFYNAVNWALAGGLAGYLGGGLGGSTITRLDWSEKHARAGGEAGARIGGTIGFGWSVKGFGGILGWAEKFREAGGLFTYFNYGLQAYYYLNPVISLFIGKWDNILYTLDFFSSIIDITSNLSGEILPFHDMPGFKLALPLSSGYQRSKELLKRYHQQLE